MADKRIRDMTAAASVAATDKIYIDDGTLVDKYATAEQIRDYAFGAGADLTKTDDTNVKLTLGGTPTGALLKATSITLGWTGTLAAARLNANVVQAITDDTNVTGSIATQTLTLGWTGTLAVSRGGTGQATAAAAFNALKQAATDAATGVVELATDAETVTGTDTARAVTPANITARLAAPGAIGGTTPAAGTFTSLAANTPYISVSLTSNQSVTTGTWTKIQFNTEASDVDGLYDNATNYRFTPNVAGLYLVVVSVSVETDDAAVCGAAIYKNGSSHKLQTFLAGGATNCVPSVTALVEMNGTTDYLEGWGYSLDGSTPRFNAGSTQTYFQARKLV